MVLAPEGERRQVTVVFADLVGFTPLAQRLDPEDLSAITFRYQSKCADVIKQFEGFVAQYLGDGVLAYFGFPLAHEDDAERAVSAGLGIVEAVRRLNDEGAWGPELRLSTRIGIATGLVVAGAPIAAAGTEHIAVVGETPALAARIQAMTKPDTVVIAASTRQLLGERFELADLGEHALKGLATPSRLWQVLRPTKALTRFEATRLSGLVPMVGREEELQLVMRRWARAKDGEGQVVLLEGEAGIGKSRIVNASCEAIAHEPHVRLRYQCSPHYGDSELYPVISQIRRALDREPTSSPDERLEALRTLLRRSGNASEEAVVLVAELLSIPVTVRTPATELSPQRRRERQLQILLDQIDGLAERHPVLMVFEDAHWADPTSRELLDGLVERVRRRPVLVVITFRPRERFSSRPYGREFSPSWIGQAHVSYLALSRLDERTAHQMIERILGGTTVTEKLKRQIHDRTDGVPLFVEEFTKTLLDSGLLHRQPDGYVLTGSLSDAAVPATLHDSLMARLDQLGPHKEVAQIGSVIGREFSYALLKAVARMEEHQLRPSLLQIVTSDLASQRGTPPHANYTFKHALVQEAAYETLLLKRRRDLHSAVVAVMETQFPNVVASDPELLAHHAERAGLYEKAVDFLTVAARRSNSRSANVEAVELLERAFKVLDKLPPGQDRAQRELELQIRLGAALINKEGPGTPAVERAYTRAMQLCSDYPELPKSGEHFAAFWGWWRISRTLPTKLERADRLLKLARAGGQSVWEVEAHHAQWATLFVLGDQGACCRHIEEGLALYEATGHASSAPVFGGHDAKVCGLGEAGLAHWLLGQPDAALRFSADSMAWARRLRHSGSIMHAMDYGAMLHRFRGDPRAALGQVEELIAYAREQRFVDYWARGMVYRGWCLTQLGDRDSGMSAMREGIAGQLQTATEEDLPIFYEMLAEGLELAGEAGAGLAELDKALTAAQRSGTRHWLAELHRRRGRLLLMLDRNHDDAALACFQGALDIAHEQQARSLELRAAVDLARLLDALGERDRARGLLVSLVEGSGGAANTPELQAALQLLGELSRNEGRPSVVADRS